MIIQLLCVLFLIPAFLACIYYNFYLLINIFCNNEHAIKENYSGKHSFVIVVPAHNEEEVIAELLESCRQINYPSMLYTVIVIADNCTDSTAAIVDRFGCQYLDRVDPLLKGKGFALEWGLYRILQQNFDAVLIIDADCSIDSRALQVFDAYLQEGFEVLQANFKTLNADNNTMTYMAALGNFFENSLYYAPKSSVGLPVALQGTGMVFSASILHDFPWKTESISEDIEYGLNLLKFGKYVKFVPDVYVGVKAPENKSQLEVQRSRWAEGTLNLGKMYGLKMIFEGMSTGKMILIDAGWSLLVISRPLLIVELLVTLLLTTCSAVFYPGLLSNIFLFFVGGILFLYLIYLITGIFSFGVSFRRIIFVVTMPGLIVKLIMITLFGLCGASNEKWFKTPRS